MDKSFVPTPDDIENVKLEGLKEKLKGDSEKETLTNILDWQVRNIKFWWERYPLAPILFIVFICFIVSFLLAYIIKPFVLIYVGCLGAIALIILVYLPSRYSSFLSEMPLCEKICKFLNLVINSFRSLPIDKILEDKLAVCRDYAKLTASLLFKIYPESELYFFKTGSHRAVGIEINNKIYVLDQCLPILTTDNWLKENKGAKVYTSKLKRDSGGKTTEVTFDERKPIPENSNGYLPYINTEKLTAEIAEILEIKQISYGHKIELKPLYKYAIYYDNDEIIKYSLIRAIKNKLENEFCGNMDKISKVNINQSQNKRDLIVTVWL